MNKVYADNLKQSKIEGGMFGKGEYLESSFLAGWKMKVVDILSNPLKPIVDTGCVKNGGGGGGRLLETKANSLRGYGRGGSWSLAALSLGWGMRAAGIFLTTLSLLLVGCGGGSEGSSDGDPSIFSTKAEIKIIPITEGWHIQWDNIADFERVGTSVRITLTSGNNPPQPLIRRIALEDFTNHSHDMVGLTNGTGYRLVEMAVEIASDIFQVVGVSWLSEENALDNNRSGIVVGANHDKDYWANSVDTDDDNDDRLDKMDDCRLGETDWPSLNTTEDNDEDGCRDNGTINDGHGEDIDDDNDGLIDRDELPRCLLNPDCDGDGLGDNHPSELLDHATRGACSILTDCDGDSLGDNHSREQLKNSMGRYCSILTDCDGDSLGDNHARERLKNSVGTYCSILDDCDGDSLGDNHARERLKNSVGTYCSILDDCDGDNVNDDAEVADRCTVDTDCDDDSLRDDHAREQLRNSGGTSCSLSNDCDSDNVNDAAEVADRCVNDTDCDDDSLRDDHTRERLSFGGTSCSLLADCDGDTVNDDAEVADRCVNDRDCDGDTVEDDDEAADKCVTLRNCDFDHADGNDGLNDNHARERLSFGGTSCSLLADCDGDTVNDDAEVADRCVNDRDCDGDTVNDDAEVADKCVTLRNCDFDHADGNDGLNDNHPRERLSFGGTSCSLLADCDGDTVNDDAEVADRCVNDRDCDGDTVEDDDEAADKCVTLRNCDFDHADGNDGLNDNHTRERLSFGGTSCSLLVDCDGDTVNDDAEVADKCVTLRNCDFDHADGNDGLNDNHTRERLSFGGTSCSLLADCDGDTVNDDAEVADRCVNDRDCDGDTVNDDAEVADKCVTLRNCDFDHADGDDGLNDNHAREQLSNSGGTSCSLLADCDGDTVNDDAEVADRCVNDRDCDGDTVNDDAEAADKCVTLRNCDDDTLEDGHARERLSFGGTSCSLLADCDGDTVEDDAEVADKCVTLRNCDFDHADGNDGLNDNHARERLSFGGTSCSLLADCDGDTVNDDAEVADRCVNDRDCDGDTVEDDDEAADKCVTLRNCDFDHADGNDGLNDNHPRERLSFGRTSCSLLADCDGDTVNDDAEAADKCVTLRNCDFDHADGDDGLNDDHPREQLMYLTNSCSLLADCDGDGLNDDDPRERMRNSMGRYCSIVPNCDGDGAGRDSVDVDVDGDGLIEVGTAEELHAVRYKLDGTASKDSGTATEDDRGCGGQTSITECSGYELVSDISLADYSNWRPIAHDTVRSGFGCQGNKFTGIFEGNNYIVRDLSINRPRENCIGLFGQAAGTIRNLIVVAESIRGRATVGGLIGWGERATIVNSFVVSQEVIGGNAEVGGLIGNGGHTNIVQSHAVSGNVEGNVDSRIHVHGEVGGLVGKGVEIEIVQSYAVTDEVKGYTEIGGLVGDGQDAKIVQSYAVSGNVEATSSSTDSRTGGLMGAGFRANIYDSYAVSGMVRGPNRVGGGLVGFTGTIHDSYWDREISGVGTASNTGAKTSVDMKSPTGYTGIYGRWENNPSSPGTIAGISAGASRFCHGDERQVWDFGSSQQYPALRCTPDTPANQRAWWFLNATHKPQLNQDRLDDWLDGTLP